MSGEATDTGAVEQERKALNQLEQEKQLGNVLFKEGKFEDALRHYSNAIQHAKDNHVLRSNRSACFSQLGRHLDALSDAEEAIRLAPAWPKGYSRKAAAHFFLKNYDEAHAAYSKALELAPNDQLISQALADVTAEQARVLRQARLQKIITLIRTQQPLPQIYLNDHGLGACTSSQHVFTSNSSAVWTHLRMNACI